MKQYVIPDIHGCSKTLNLLLDKIGLHKTDKLYFLGDFIDKGNDSAGVLDIVMTLMEKGYTVYPIRGNHEENLLHAHQEYDARLFAGFVGKINKSQNLLDEKGQIIDKYLNFISSLPYYYELDKFWVVHAGFNTKKPDFLNDVQSMVELRSFVYDEKLLKNKKVIRGHEVKPDDEIKRCIENNEMIISLDNGCVYKHKKSRHNPTQTGKLNCLELESMKLIQVENVD